MLGHIVPLLRNPLRFFRSLPDYGDLVRIRLGPFLAIVVCDPGLNRQVLLADRTFDKGGPLVERGRELAGDGLPACPHSRHRRQRRLLQPAFHSLRLQGYAQAMMSHITTVTNSWRGGQVLDVTTEMQTITARITVETMFSDKLSAAALHQALDDLTIVTGGIFQRMLMPPPIDRLPTPGNRRYHQARVRLRDTMLGIIAEHPRHGTDRGDLLSAMLASRDLDSGTEQQGLSDTEICDQVVSFFFAGTETTALVLAWALYFLAQHPLIEQQLHAEVDNVLNGSAAAYEHLPRLSLTSRIITETLRMYPPVWLLTRSTTADSQLGGQHIPAGTTIVYSPYLIHHRSDLYPEPERFDPDRWDSALRPPPPRDAFIPFGSGPRKCIGDHFAMLEATLALATIAARFYLRPLSSKPIRPAVGALLHPHGLRMRAIARHPTW